MKASFGGMYCVVNRSWWCLALATVCLSCFLGLSAYGKTVPAVTIGRQEWMRENLDVERFRNGDLIGQVETPAQWKQAGDEGRAAWCYCDYDPNLGKTYGKLYNGYAITDPRGLAPEGWHVPGEAEWRALVAHLGGAAMAGGKMKATGTAYWNSPNARATDESGFGALPAGYADPHGGFHYLGRGANFWCVSDTACYWSGTTRAQRSAATMAARRTMVSRCGVSKMRPRHRARRPARIWDKTGPESSRRSLRRAPFPR